MMRAHIRASGPEFCDFFDEILVSVEEKAQPLSEAVHVEPRVYGSLNISDAVCEREGNFLDGRRTGLSYMIPAYADGVPLRNVLITKGKDVSNDAHGGHGRKDVSAPCRILLENIVLNGAPQLAGTSSLLLSSRDVHCQ